MSYINFKILLACWTLFCLSAPAQLVLAPGTAIEFGDGTMQATAASGSGAPPDHGGVNSYAVGENAWVGGGKNNVATGKASALGGGDSNLADGDWSVIAGGLNNQSIGMLASVLGGYGNQATGSTSCVLWGEGSAASGWFSVAGGFEAHATHDFSVVINASNTGPVNSDRNGQIKIQTLGGVHLECPQSSGLSPAAFSVNTISSNGVAIFASQTSTDSAMVLTNKGSGDLIKCFGGTSGGNLRFRVTQAGNVAIDGTYSSGGADVAEYLPKRKVSEELPGGTVVGVFPDGVSLNTDGAERIQVVSSCPMLLGNMPAEEDSESFAPIAFLGQVPVRVNGPVAEGDYLIASGRHDGTAFAVSREDINIRQFSKVIGTAMESSLSQDERLIRARCGFNHDALWQGAIEDRDRRIASLEDRLARIEVLLNTSDIE